MGVQGPRVFVSCGLAEVLGDSCFLCYESVGFACGMAGVDAPTGSDGRWRVYA